LAPLQAHLFVFWFALLSTITPPVCGAVFIAAGMVGENWLKVAVHAMALGVGLYVIPLAMISSPGLIAMAESPGAAALAFVKTAAGLSAISFGLIGTRAIPIRAGLAAAGAVVCLWPLSA
ncbi:MAG: TRAP transporter large permease subunit, partial [Pseudomonadota bacterium]